VTISTVVLATGLALMLIGICGMLTQRDILRTAYNHAVVQRTKLHSLNLLIFMG